MIRTQSASRLTPWILLAFLLVGPLVWAGCDMSSAVDAPQSLVMTYEGDVPIKHSALGDGQLDVGDDGTVVFRSPNGNGGIRLDVDGARQGDFFFQPAGISQGETFTQSVLGRSGTPLAQVEHVESSEETYNLTADLGNLSIESAALQLRNGDDVLYEAPFSPTDQTEAPVGKSSQTPDSFHYETETVDGETITIIAVDYETEATADPTAPNREFSPKSTSGGQALIWPSGTKKGPFPSTHVSLVLKGTSISPGDIQGIALEGAKELTILNAALGNAY